MTKPVAIGIDIGGTRLRAAALAQDGTVLERFASPTPASDETLLVDAIAAVANRLGKDLPIGVGIAGIVTSDGVLRYGTNILVRDVPLAAHIRTLTNGEVVVANDASVAAFGEQRAGAGAGYRDVVMFTLGTGVGGGIVLDDNLMLGSSGYGAELGHVVVNDGGRLCPCGNHGCIEAYASGSAFGAIARERLAESDTPSTLRELEQVEGPDVSRAAASGDPLAISVLEDAGRWLGIAIGSMVNALDPHLVLIGGGAAKPTAPHVLPIARETMSSMLLGGERREPPPVQLAVLGDDAGMVGAGMLAAERQAVSA